MSDAIEARGLKKRFGAVRAVDGIDLAVPEGTVFGLLGPNGAGKTTAVRVLTTILRPDEGQARVLGHDVVADPDAVRRSIGLAGQFAAVDENLTGRENLRMVGRLTQLTRSYLLHRADELLSRFGLDDAADRPVKTYSGGMRRRLDLAAALVHSPPVLFLDEPTTGLDPASRNDVWAMVQELVSDGTTVLLTTQYLEEADRLADHVVVVDHGTIIASGSPSELKRTIGTTVIDVGLRSANVAKRAARALAKLSAAPPALNESVVELSVENGPRALVEIVRTLERARIAPLTLEVREASLDDVFLALTGHRAEEESGGEDAETERGAA
jgi:daunorubicin resistance ABC transporter ATP-binding subunit